MNENLNLVEILKDCPEGTKLYSPIIGEVEFKRIKYCEYPEYPIVTRCGNRILSFTKEGLFFPEGECIMLFPSKDQRDWSQFKQKQPKFDPKTLQPYDKVLAKFIEEDDWRCTFFSHIRRNPVYKYATMDCASRYCIPYNDDTKHLVGTTDEAPEFYRYWED